jgi:hypothetical protein
VDTAEEEVRLLLAEREASRAEVLLWRARFENAEQKLADGLKRFRELDDRLKEIRRLSG